VFQFREARAYFFYSLRSQGGANRAPLAHAKALRTGVSVPMRRHSSRLPRGAKDAAATTSKPPHVVASAAEPQREATAVTTVMTTATTASLALPAPAPAGGDQTAVVDITYDDALPPG
jgi:hypothetical protein